jgi:hypothetical protein
MKLAEALALRADLQKKISQMDGRLKGSCIIQEDDTPPEDPLDIFSELNDCLKQLEDLTFRINKTNINTILSDNETITRKIARRDMLKKQVSILQSILEYVSQPDNRYSRTEIKLERNVDVGKLRKQTDSLSCRLRETDTEIQAANWNIDLCK